LRVEDAINRLRESRNRLPNASYFAFTATPKNKTLEIFGEPFDEAGVTKHRPFHTYSMKQAIQEGFILDVLASYTPVDSYYRLVKTVEGDPEFDVKRARRKLRHYVESHDHAIRLKAEIMVDHFHEQVIALNKLGGQARAMVVCSSIDRALRFTSPDATDRLQWAFGLYRFEEEQAVFLGMPLDYFDKSPVLAMSPPNQRPDFSRAVLAHLAGLCHFFRRCTIVDQNHTGRWDGRM
jgi:hypothetical protein